MFLCRHGCAVYRKWKEVDFNYVLANLVDKKYTFGNVKNMLRKNVSLSVWMGFNMMVLPNHLLLQRVSRVGLRPKGFATGVSSLLLRIPLLCVQIVVDVVITEEPALPQHGRFYRLLLLVMATVLVMLMGTIQHRIIS